MYGGRRLRRDRYGGYAGWEMEDVSMYLRTGHFLWIGQWLLDRGGIAGASHGQGLHSASHTGKDGRPPSYFGLWTRIA